MSKFLFNRFHHRIDLLFVRHVRVRRDRLTAGVLSFDRLNQLGDAVALGLEIDDGDVESVFCELERNGGADSWNSRGVLGGGKRGMMSRGMGAWKRRDVDPSKMTDLEHRR